MLCMLESGAAPHNSQSWLLCDYLFATAHSISYKFPYPVIENQFRIWSGVNTFCTAPARLAQPAVLSTMKNSSNEDSIICISIGLAQKIVKILTIYNYWWNFEKLHLFIYTPTHEKDRERKTRNGKVFFIRFVQFSFLPLSFFFLYRFYNTKGYFVQISTIPQLFI